MRTRMLSSLDSKLVKLSKDVSAAKLTTFGLGAPVKNLLEPQSIEGLLEVRNFLISESIEHRVLGAGSNVVLSDNVLESPVLKLGRSFSKYCFLDTLPKSLTELERILCEVRVEEAYDEMSVLVFAGTPMMTFSRQISSLGYSGFEFASGIPASLGGAVAMNAGAHDSDISDLIEQVYILNNLGELQIIQKSDMQFSYRRSGLDENDCVIAAAFRLRPGDKESIVAKRKKFLEYRKATQPLSLPSSGSVFVNPPSNGNELIYAASLLESSGLKGRKRGGVEFSELHANWLVRTGPNAKASDFEYLVQTARDSVYENTSIELSTEIKLWK